MPSTHSTEYQKLRDAYKAIKDRIGEAAVRSGRTASHVSMIAVTKTATPDQIRQIVDFGVVDLGESRAQQLEKRVATLEEFLSRRRTLGGVSTREGTDSNALPTQVRWHMLGHMQRNKVKQVVPHVQLIHSVDSLRLAEELHTYGAKYDLTIEVLLQINASGERQKSGVAVPAVLHLADQIDTMMHLKLRGIMAMAPHVENPEDARLTFARTKEIFDEGLQKKVGGQGFNILSMGMSNDFEVAIEEGANLVRIGSALFGKPMLDEDFSQA